MFAYATHFIWYNEVRHRWIVQRGICTIGDYATIGAAKRAATLSNRAINAIT